MNTRIKGIPVNPNLSLQRCWDMVNRVESVREGAIAEAWLEANTVISTDEYDELMRALTYQIREAYRREAERA